MQDYEPAAPSSNTCQVAGCNINLNRLRVYFRRQRICEEHSRAESVPDGYGGLARFCQQCTRLEPLSFFDGQRRSCRSSLAKRQERMSAARRRNHSGSDGHLSGSNSDGPAGGKEEVGGVSTRLAALRAVAGTASPHSSASPLRYKRSRSTSPPRLAVGPAAVPLAAPPAASGPSTRPLAATFPSPAALLQPRASGEANDDSSAATAQLGLLLPSMLAGLMGARAASGSMPLAVAGPAATAGLPSVTQSYDDVTAFLASLAAAGGSSKAMPALDGSGGSAAAAVAAVMAAGAAPLPGSVEVGPPHVPLPHDPHELRQMLSTLLQLQALVSSVIIPQVQQRLAALELAAVLGVLSPHGTAAAAAAAAAAAGEPPLSVAQQPVQQPMAAQAQAAPTQPAPPPPQLGLHVAGAHALPAAAQDVALVELLGSLVSQQEEEQQRRRQQEEQPPPQRPQDRHAHQPVLQQEGERGDLASQAQAQAGVQQPHAEHAELPAEQLVAALKQLLGQ